MWCRLIHVILFISCSSLVIAQNSNPANPADPISPVINFLEQLQKLRQLYLPNRQNSQNALSSFFPERSSTNIPKPPLDSGNFLPLSDNSITQNSNSQNNNNNAGGTRFVVQLPSQFGIGRPRTPEDNQRVTLALTELLQGVRTASLERILRGSFGFTRNDNVRSVADTVIRNIFTRNSSGSGQRRGIFSAFGNSPSGNTNSIK